jgi:putative PEP-CTERM system histidine kinase
MDSFPAAFALYAYGVAFVGFAVFGLQLLMGTKQSPRARLLAFCMMWGAAWCALSAGFVLEPHPLLWMLAHAADALHYVLFLLFLAACVVDPEGRQPLSRLLRSPSWLLRLLVVLVTPCAIGYVVLSWLVPTGKSAFIWFMASGLGLSLLGAVMTEQFYRNTPQQWRWGIKPMTLGLAFTLIFDLYFFSESLMFREQDTTLWAARGLLHALAIPLFAASSARIREWSIRLNVSREAVFHTSALVISGGALLLIALAGYYVRYFGGEWGRALQTVVLAAGALGLLASIASGSVRAWLRVFINKHFFSLRYDYRAEWLKLADTLYSASSVDALREASIRVMADLVESPGGILWLRSEQGHYAPAARLNVPMLDAREPADSPLVRLLLDRMWVINVEEHRSRPGVYGDLRLPEWVAQIPDAWLMCPLGSKDMPLGFVVLGRPRALLDLNWEVRDLLKTAGRQVAGVLNQTQAMEGLIEAKKFEAFSKMSAFVVHDLKNLIAQLSLLLRNAKKHHDNPEFQQDMLDTIEHAVGRMNSMLLQLRSGTQPIEQAAPVALTPLLERLHRARARSACALELDAEGGLFIRAHEDRIERVVGHLVQNALDATPQNGKVSIRARRDGDGVVVEVEDSGCGMTEEFVRERLFKPFQSTKANGMGIGAYESFRYIQDLGGRIEVDSEPGRGSLFRLVFPQQTAGLAVA